MLLVHLCGAAVNKPLSCLLLASKCAAASNGSNSYCELERLSFKASQKINCDRVFQGSVQIRELKSTLGMTNWEKNPNSIISEKDTFHLL